MTRDKQQLSQVLCSSLYELYWIVFEAQMTWHDMSCSMKFVDNQFYNNQSVPSISKTKFWNKCIEYWFICKNQKYVNKVVIIWLLWIMN
jgi:hypothetical protein